MHLSVIIIDPLFMDLYFHSFNDKLDKAFSFFLLDATLINVRVCVCLKSRPLSHIC